MRFNLIVPTGRITAIHPVTAQQQRFPSTGIADGMWFPVPFTKDPLMLNVSDTGHRITAGTPGRAVFIPNLITCAAAVYVYTNGAGAVQGVAVVHAHTGVIPDEHNPMQPVYNHGGVPAEHVHVVFASSQSMDRANPRAGIQTAADGLFTVLAKGVPLENILIVTGTSTFGANIHGDVGVRHVPAWLNGNVNLRETFVAAVAGAQDDYVAQFPPGVATLGLFGSGHNRALGKQRVTFLKASINAAKSDREVLRAVETFLTGPYSYKDGSLKLFVVRRIYYAVVGLPMANVTPANAREKGSDLLTGIEGGRY
jgi:hypothetical protein